MKVRWCIGDKLFGAMAVLVLFVTVGYYGATQGYLKNRFDDYFKAKTTDLFVTHYLEHNHSWEGIELLKMSSEEEQRNPHERELALLSTEGGILFYRGAGDPGALMQTGKRNTVVVNGTTVGTIYADRWESAEEGQIKKYILASMHTSALRVPAVTGIIALLLGLWLTKKITQPLNRLLPAIHQIGVGELPIRIPVTTRDEFGKVTEALNHMGQQLFRAEEVRKHLTADVAHELRTPLSIIQCHMEMIQEAGRDIPPETLLPIQDEVIRLSKLVDDLHQLTLAEAGKLRLDRSPADLVPLLDRIIEMLKPEAEERHIDMVRSYPAQPLNALIDSNRMTQVFYNLLVNALRYTSSGGRISIRLKDHFHEESRYVTVTIADTGAGIAAERLPFLFDRFYRVEESRSRHTGGMGLGLAIAKEFVEAHHGFISVQSEVGRGTQFTVELPCS
ncbi:sensor histidine kinase [Paenibacillus mucilaginosus]|uniref:histidine kinase n=2 Tax=Paenibacillus mucilaginosus TaxID=61624 RepID=H6NMX2_9BACL|nr:ATP-binding protein [Paenibacillus mucilaginosus]AEI43359.1 sensory transduction histidine kinase [Paenibacillus mucilaginosus KNP414]AFC31012.1 sensory transduction histidine kinase [Paenibacillus mucilaginosus 3016]MCG7212092.1 ATP-binding protein [Paenibacillus mucilaginosus]WDM24930.1 HAMP domain-containing protein [Paenibacillus mucilaginosus]WFA19605.1 HAMP domain-containing protein [Paenibacillus mucilaginosus]